MWTATNTIAKIHPAYNNVFTGNTDYVAFNTYESIELNANDATSLYLYKIIFNPKYESNLFSNLNANIRIASIANNNNIVYVDSSIETLANTRQYLTALNFYQKNTLDTIYLFTPTVENVYINVEYELSNISTLKDLYPFIANTDNLISLQIKSSPEGVYQAITKDFLLSFNLTYATAVKVTLRYKLIDSTNLITSVFNNTLQVERKNVNVYTHTLENWQDIDIITTELKHDYYRNELFSSLSNPGFIINSNYIYQVL